MKVVLTKKNERIIIDDTNFDFVAWHYWHVNNKGYVVRSINGGRKKIYLHRELIKIEGQKYKGRVYVIHINGNKLDNRLENLLISSSGCPRGYCCKNKKKFKRFTKRGNSYQAQVSFMGKSIYLGSYKKASEARKASLDFLNKRSVK
jgi:hypothetical protein